MTKWNRRLAGALALAVVSSLATMTAAPANATEPQAHDGFFLRASAGISAGNAKLESGGVKFELKDPALDVNIAVGYVVLPNLAVHGTLWGWGLNDPDVDVTGIIGGSVPNHGIFEMTAFGAGATYYVMPLNAYISSSIGMGAFSGTDQLDGQSTRGFAVDITAGKEWWVNPEWGAGAAICYTHTSADDKDLGPTGLPTGSWTGSSWGIRFTATFN
jgi:hypothetical protein